MMKLNVLLAMTDALRTKYKNMITDHTRFYTNSQGSFKGIQATYIAKEGMLDDPSKRKFTRVITTVNEKLEYFINESEEFINALFSQEKTNASGLAQAELIVDGKSWGTFTSLELLRLKSLLESSDLGNLEGMISHIPVRTDSLVYSKNTQVDYKDRDIWETSIVRGTSKTSVKEESILKDPNINPDKLTPSYSPKVTVKTKTVEVGDYTLQEFSGEWSHRERAEALKRRNTLLLAVIKALKECNECEVVDSGLNANKIFGYLLFKE